MDNHHFYPARRFKKNQDEQFVGAEHSELVFFLFLGILFSVIIYHNFSFIVYFFLKPCSPTWVAEIPVHDFKKNTPEKTCIFMRAVDDSGNIEVFFLFYFLVSLPLQSVLILFFPGG